MVMSRGACLDCDLHQGPHQAQAKERPGNGHGDFVFIPWVACPR
jgi:hypothetical protein